MRIALEHLDLKGLAIDFPSLPDSVDQRILLRSTSALKGSLEQTTHGLRLSGVSAARAVLEMLALKLGSVLLNAPRETTFSELRMGYEQRDERLDLELEADKCTRASSRSR